MSDLPKSADEQIEAFIAREPSSITPTGDPGWDDDGRPWAPLGYWDGIDDLEDRGL